jgi:hypothetical protein
MEYSRKMTRSTSPASTMKTTETAQCRNQRCYFILSTKSSGSSVLQRHLSALTSASLPNSYHWENETLFFTKAASVLGLPQVPLINSHTPYSRQEGMKGLLRFLSDNVGEWTTPLRTEDDMFNAWNAVVRACGGDLVEKSPHHLYQKSVVALMERYADRQQDIDVQFIGLVRNPLATLYSSWRRFGMRPVREERHWVNAYRTLLSLADRRPEQVKIIRYEDMVVEPGRLASLLGIDEPAPTSETLHGKSVERWRHDGRFRHHLSDEAIQVAQRFGYQVDELLNPMPRAWTTREEVRALAWELLYTLPPPARIAVQTRGTRIAKALRKVRRSRSRS